MAVTLSNLSRECEMNASRIESRQRTAFFPANINPHLRGVAYYRVFPAIILPLELEARFIGNVCTPMHRSFVVVYRELVKYYAPPDQAGYIFSENEIKLL